MKETFAKLLKHTSIYSISEIASRAVGFLLIPLYTRYLTPADYGVLEILFTSQSILLIIANQGISSSLFKFWSDSSEDAKITLASSCLWYEIVSSAVIAALGIYFSDNISSFLLNTPQHGYLFRLIFLTLVINLIQLVLRQILRARLESVKVSSISLVKLVFAASLNIYLIVVMHMGLSSIIISDLIASTVSAALAYWYARRFISFKFSFNQVSNLLSFGIPLIGVGLSNWLLSVSDRYFLAHYSTPTELGLYSLAYKFSGVLSLILLQPFLSTWPSIYFDAAKRPDGKEFFSRSARYFALAFSVAGVGLFLASNIAIRILTPPEFWPSTRVVYILVGSVLLEGLNNIYVAGLYLTSKTKYPTLFTGIAACSNLGLNALLIPSMGMEGAAIATLLSYALLVVLTFRAAQQFFPVRYTTFRTASNVLCFLAIGGLATAIPPQGILLDSLIAAAIFLCAAIAGFFSPLLTKTERSLAGSILRAIQLEGFSGAIKKLRTVA